MKTYNDLIKMNASSIKFDLKYCVSHSTVPATAVTIAASELSSYTITENTLYIEHIYQDNC